MRGSTFTYSNGVHLAWLPDDGWYSALGGHPGVWGLGDTVNESLEVLVDVLRDWHQVGDHSTPCDCTMEITA